MKKTIYALVKYVGEGEERFRLESGGEKVVFAKGDVHYVEASRALSMCGAHQFEVVPPLEITAEMVETATKRFSAGPIEEEKKTEKKAGRPKRTGNE